MDGLLGRCGVSARFCVRPSCPLHVLNVSPVHFGPSYTLSSFPPSPTPSLRYARGKTLKEEALVKNKVASRTAIVSMLQQGKGVMPKYGSYTRKNGDVVPAKLSEQEMGIVADYVLEQAKAGWK